MELHGKAVVIVSYERPWELFPASPFAHNWVCGWQWPGHVLTPKGPAPTACRAHTCYLSGIYRPDTRLTSVKLRLRLLKAVTTCIALCGRVVKGMGHLDHV